MAPAMVLEMVLALVWIWGQENWLDMCVVEEDGLVPEEDRIPKKLVQTKNLINSNCAREKFGDCWETVP